MRERVRNAALQPVAEPLLDVGLYGIVGRYAFGGIQFGLRAVSDVRDAQVHVAAFGIQHHRAKILSLGARWQINGAGIKFAETPCAAWRTSLHGVTVSVKLRKGSGSAGAHGC